MKRGGGIVAAAGYVVGLALLAVIFTACVWLLVILWRAIL